jgi:hypothetical protein
MSGVRSAVSPEIIPMNTLPPLLLLGLLALSARAAELDDQLPPTSHGKSLKLTWHGEFDGDRLDQSKWEPRPDGKRKGGWWGAEAISLDSEGHLKPQAVRLIFDTDMMGDVDDVGTAAVLHALADQGEVEVRAWICMGGKIP